MDLKGEIADVMLSRGFKRKRIASSIWFTRSRRGQWTDAYCIEMKSRSSRFSLSFGIENAAVRALALSAAAEISPKAYLAIGAPPFVVTKQPSINIFVASMENPIVHLSYDRLDQELIDFIETRYFDSVVSSIDYLHFLKGSTGVFDWICSAGVFRLIYIGYLYRLEGVGSAEFADFCLSIPKKHLENHMMLRRDGLSAEAFIAACMEKIWR